MTPADIFADFRSRIVGHEIRFRRLATNSLLVYIDSEPGENEGLTIWFEPTWHLRDQTRVLTGSRQAQDDEDADEPSANFQAASAAVNELVGQLVLALDVDPITGDLRLEATTGLVLVTFVSDPTDDHKWHIRDNVSRLALYQGAAGLEVVAPDA